MPLQLSDSVHINASPAVVWDFLADPQKVKLWNPKLKEVKQVSIGQPSLGYRYEVVYEMKERRRKGNAEITEYDAPHKLTIKLVGEEMPFQAMVFESYSLVQTPDGTQVNQLIQIQNTNAPVWVRWLFNFLGRSVRSSGTGYLRNLRQVLEEPQT
jgi:carbon monoxide dehydrogenase subunit G